MSTINFNDKIFAQQTLEAFARRMKPFSSFARDFSIEARQIGDAIAVPRIDSVSVTTFSASNNGGVPYENEGGVINTITVNLNNHHIASVDITDLQALVHSPARAENFRNKLVNDLASRFFDRVLSIVTPGTFGAVVTSVSMLAYSRNQIRAIRKAMVKANCPMDNVSLWLNPDLFDSLLGDENVARAGDYGGSEAVRDGAIPRLLGFNVFEIVDLPTNGVSLAGFGACADALALAARPVVSQEPGEYLSHEIVTDPETGLSLTYKRHYSPGKGKMFINMECLFGFAAGITPGLKMLATTD